MSTPVFETLAGLEDSYDQIQKKAIGGMAEIYVARQKNLDRPVAIKRIRPELKHTKDIRERFRREARAAANLLHQNLAHVYDFRAVTPTDGVEDLYIIMEWIDGYDLAEIIDKGPMAIDVACMIALKVLQGLSAIHAQGMVHRDLKPDNIRVSTRGEVKIMDFGIALDPSDSNLTQPGVLIGSPHYLSPEQIVGAKLDGRADLFSFGITFYEMLTGQKPFKELGSETVYMRIQKGQYVRPEEINPAISPFLSKLIDSCLQVQMNGRPSSANRAAASLQEFILRKFSLSFEARIKQYLLQVQMMPGNPNLIEIEERTADKTGSESLTNTVNIGESKKSLVERYLFVWIFLAILILGSIGFIKLSAVKDAPPTQSIEQSLPAATVAAPRPAAPAPAPRKNPAPQVEDDILLKDIPVPSGDIEENQN